VQAFQAAYQLAPTDVEIVNNFGYAYLRNDDPEAAEPWLLLALVLAPGRVDAWVNLGQGGWARMELRAVM
jgi:Flp pilus assembly protein TadD